MKYSDGSRTSHTTAGSSVKNAEFLLADPRHPDAAFIQRELELDRKREWYLVPKAIFALVIVAVLVLLRQLYFA
jgi:hypothetical protein